MDYFSDSHTRAAAILKRAGWLPHPEWDGAFSRRNLVGGVKPDKSDIAVIDWTAVPAGVSIHSDELPTCPADAARLLVANYKPSAKVLRFHRT